MKKDPQTKHRKSMGDLHVLESLVLGVLMSCNVSVQILSIPELIAIGGKTVGHKEPNLFMQGNNDL